MLAVLCSAAVTVWLASGCGTSQISVAEDETVRGLLLKVQEARSSSDCVQADLKIVQNQPGLPKRDFTLDCAVDVRRDQRRFEIRARSDTTRATLLYKGADLYGYTYKPGADLDVYDMQRAVGVRGDFSFDPRVIGLSDLMLADHTVSNCVGAEDDGTGSVIGRQVDGVKTTWMLVKKYEGSRFPRSVEWLVEEPSYRVLRKTLTWDGGKSVVTSTYRTSKSVFPDGVTVLRTEAGQIRRDVKLFVERFVNEPPAEDRFELSSLELPINTMVNDYRLKRITGYWDGKAIVVNPVDFQESKDRAAKSPSR